MHIAVIVNKKRYDPKIISSEKLTELTAKYNFTFDFFVCEGKNLESLCTELAAKTFNAILISGGDGTIRSAVQCLVGRDQPIIVLPTGTFNIFAKMLGYPSDLEGAIKIILNHKTKQVDVGVVNNIVFLNHATIGFYAHVIKQRGKYKKTLGKSRVLKILFTALNFWRVIPIYKLAVEVNGQVTEYETCLLFVANNYQSTDLFDFGNRQTISSGQLAVYILNCQSRWQLIKILISFLLNRFDNSKYVSVFLNPSFTIYSRAKMINLVLDGELFKLESPLHYTVYNKQLMVLVP